MATVKAANAGWKDSTPIGNVGHHVSLLYADSCKQAPSTVHPATQEASLCQATPSNSIHTGIHVTTLEV